MRICIDPGHGGEDPGAVGSFEGVRILEKDFNLGVAAHLFAALAAEGHECEQTRYMDHFVALVDRAAFANELGCNLFVSIHANAADRRSAKGFEVFHFAGSAKGRAVAESIEAAFRQDWPERASRGVKQGRFAVLRHTRMPAVLVEAGFLTNPEDLALLASFEQQELFAETLARGIASAESALVTPQIPA